MCGEWSKVGPRIERVFVSRWLGFQLSAVAIITRVRILVQVTEFENGHLISSSQPSIAAFSDVRIMGKLGNWPITSKVSFLQFKGNLSVF